MISVVDYGVGNLGSILNMLRKLKAEAQLISTADEVLRAQKLILPGVGAFDRGVSALIERKLVDPIRQKVLDEKVPILGICLGMQLLGRTSEEGKLSGLGLLDAHCQRFSFEPDSPLKIPHMGWNQISTQRDSPLSIELDDRSRFYFVHSYHLVCNDPIDVLALTKYGIDFAAIVQRENVMGTQFHPEKSHRFGMALLNNFVRI